ncbi:MAG: 30S ribosomal protein S13 [Candidatus Aenigmarchaeota archaeon]|nr:30S ribosomal protein S13 [Candidatus Aenigmarchaeota archaeon]
MSKDKSKDGESGEKISQSNEQPKGHPKESPVKRTRIVRLGGKDLDGDMKVSRAMSEVRGVSYTLANAVSKVSGLGDKNVIDLTEAEIKKIEDIMSNPGNYGIPEWIFNRRSDPETGESRHNISAQLELRHKMDINELKKRKNYKGVRHIQKLPVRGQRTRSSFRKSGKAVGVSRTKNKAPAGKSSGKK